MSNYLTYTLKKRKKKAFNAPIFRNVNFEIRDRFILIKNLLNNVVICSLINLKSLLTMGETYHIGMVFSFVYQHDKVDIGP